MVSKNLHGNKKISKPLILSFSYVLLGGLIKLIFDIIIEKKVGVDTFTFPTFLIILLLIIIALVHFILNEKRNFKNICDEYKKNICFHCDIVTDRQKRHSKMIERIREAKEKIFIFSNLPGANIESDEVKKYKKFHEDFLKELNKKYNKDNIEILRIITPNITIDCDNEDAIRSYFNNIKKDPIYKDHFELLEKDSNLLGLLNAPRGITILFIDNKYLFFVIETKYSNDHDTKLQHQLKNGFYFEEYNSNSSILESTFGRCFKEMQNQAKQIKDFL